jgi:RHS repeat-associated protein
VAKESQVMTTEDTPGYTGHLEDDELGLTYMQQRYYDPVIGRFYSNDPVGFTGGKKQATHSLRKRKRLFLKCIFVGVNF